MKTAAFLLGVLCLWSWKPASAQTVSIENPTYIATEGGDSLTICVVLDMNSVPITQASQVALTIDLPLINFQLLVTLSLDPGVDRMCGSLNFPNNNVDDGTQTLTIQATTNSAGISLGRSVATLTLLDDDGVPMCPGLSNPENGAVSFSQGMIEGSVAMYSCNTPYILNGNTQRTCTVLVGAGLLWTGTEPTCEFPTSNSASISYQLAAYTVMEASSTQVCIVIEGGFVGISFGIWYHRVFPSFSIWAHWEFRAGLVAGDVVCGTLSAAEDNLRENGATVTVPLEIPGNVTGVSAVGNTAFSLTFLDNDGPEIDECAMGLDNCSPNALCTNTPGGFFCTCNSGFTGNGVTCFDIDECSLSTNNCSFNGACLNTEGSFLCFCNIGFSGDGVVCENDNECMLGTDNCDDNALCIDTFGGFLCNCNSGFRGNGMTCLDEDECALGTDNCADEATCTNFIGGFTCTCPSGFTGDGGTCVDIDECAVGSDDCDANAACINNAGSFDCLCFVGFRGDGRSGNCADIDECSEDQDDCDDDNAQCTNTMGSFTCACDSGYFGDGSMCTDIDECASEQDNCHPNATCTNTPGNFSCVCDDDFFGNGVVCMPDMVQLRLVPQLYSVVEGEYLAVAINVYNPSDENITVSGSFHVSGGVFRFYVFFTFEALAQATFVEYVNVMFPDDSILNKMAQQSVELELESTSELAVVVEGYDSADIIVVDDDIVKIGFNATRVYVLEDAGLVHVCVELIRGEGCQRPIVLRANTKECPDDAYPADEGADFEALWEIGSIAINSEQGSTECFYVNIEDDINIEANETFKIMLEAVDVNVYVLVDTVTVVIIDDDNITRFCPELSVANGSVTVGGGQQLMGEQAVGTTAHYSCDEFYELEAGNPYRNCQANGTWTGEDLTCMRIAINLTCTPFMGGNPVVQPDLSCTAMGPLPTFNTVCSFNDGAYEECDLAAPISSEVVGRLGSGNHTLYIMVTDSDGETAQFSFDFMIAPALGLNCVRVELTAFFYSFTCTADTSLTSLLCSVNPSLGNVPCMLDVVNTIPAPPLMDGVDYSLTVTAIDVFQQQEVVTRTFTLPDAPTLEVLFIDDTPIVDGTGIVVSFEANNPLASATCAISGRNPISGPCNLGMDAFSGSFVFSPVDRVGPRDITITATASNGQTFTLTRGVRSGSTGRCSAHLINEGVVISGTSVTVEFMISGPTDDNTSSTCRIGSQVLDPCTSGDTINNVSTADLQEGLIITPVDSTPLLCTRILPRLISLVV
ncbi:uncharacterized protein LOC135352313 [Halichondria panicea]|uniref:uncharacterized protein LOC135352313 n=1 Tax=Halichondria panicea TaxID=6063 RepID=UPI00312B4FD2